uniref:uncharacterized protein LOC122610189 n=1 Tax=Erigeron canadensis TaxID=72917 RepID=UPI001CB8BD10|nr:uncharacterized protein LOC122610189 [Erigeron canadensis]
MIRANPPPMNRNPQMRNDRLPLPPPAPVHRNQNQIQNAHVQRDAHPRDQDSRTRTAAPAKPTGPANARVFALNLRKLVRTHGLEALLIRNQVYYLYRSQKLAACIQPERVEHETEAWVELLNDYDCEIKYHPGKANVVADALSRKERVKILSIKEADRTDLRQLEFEVDDNGVRKFKSRVWIPAANGVREIIMQEAHRSKYSIHPGANKMYKNLKLDYWWPGMKREIFEQTDEISRFLPIRDDYSLERLAEIYIDDIVTKYGVPLSIVSDRDPRFTSDFWQSLQEALGTRLNLSTAYHPQSDGQSERTIQTLEDMLRSCALEFKGCAPFEALYGRKCRSPLCWLDAGERSWMRLPVVQTTIDKIVVIKEKLKAAQDRQKSYTDRRRKPLEFKCMADDPTIIPVKDVHIDEGLEFTEEPIEIVDKDAKQTRQSRVPLFRVR